MLLLLSPAKSLDWSPAAAPIPPTEPELLKDAGILARKAKRLKVTDLQELMGISEKLAVLNRDRFLDMTVAPDADRDRPAALAFDGDVYRGLDARSLDDEGMAWAQEHVGILSGLYGLLRPMDLIEPYRLEMGTRLKTRRGKSLYDFWGDTVRLRVQRRVKEHGDAVVVNLASNEYFRVVKAKKLKARVVTCHFKEELDDGQLKMISFFAKWARGAMTRWAVDHRVGDVEELKGFDTGGYAFRPGLSSADEWVFSRPKPPPVGAAGR